MFKFFRLYNKIILVVGGCVLMVAFLVPQSVQMFGPNPLKQEVGQINGQTITQGDLNNAGGELQILSALPFAAALPTQDELTWLMIQAEAEELGLWASDGEVQMALETVGLDDEQLAQWTSGGDLTPAMIRHAVRRLLIAEQYRHLVTGTAYRDPQGRSPSLAVQRIETLSQYMQQAQQMPAQYQQMFFQMALAESAGTHRLSGPHLRHFIQDNYAGVGGRLVLIHPDADAAPQPDDATLQRVFETYRDFLPGQGEPYPFGYRYPDRVKLRYIEIPRRAVSDAVEVDYVEVLDAYRNNKDRFAAEDQPAPDRPTPEAVQTLTGELRDRKAGQLMNKIVAQVRGLLAEDVRGLPEADGYLALPEGFQPVSLEQVAEQVRQTHGVAVRVMGDADRWVPVSELRQLEGIGFSALGEGAQPVMFDAYVGQTRALQDDPAATPRGLRSQLHVASKALSGFDGSTYIFRLVDAQPAHAPQSLDEVREQVVADAKAIAAYESLVAEQDAWRQRVIEEGLDAVAASAGASVVDLPPFQKVAGEQGRPPSLPRVGESRPLVDAAFALTQRDTDMPTDPQQIAELPIAQRLAVVPLPATDQGPALALFELTTYEPLTRSGYETQLQAGASMSANMSLLPDDPTDPHMHPLSRESLARRTGFQLDATE